MAKFTNFKSTFNVLMFFVCVSSALFSCFDNVAYARTHTRHHVKSPASRSRKSKTAKRHYSSSRRVAVVKPNETKAHLMYVNLYDQLDNAYQIYNQANNEALNHNYEKAFTLMNQAVELFDKCGVQGQCMNILVKRQLLDLKIASSNSLSLTEFLQRQNIAFDQLSSDDMVKLIDFYLKSNDINQAQLIFNKAENKYPDDFVLKKISPKIITNE